MKEQAKDFYNKYKEIKKVFLRDRKIWHEKNTTLDNDIKVNIEENTKLKSIYQNLLDELGFVRRKLGIKDKHLAKGS